MNDWVSAHLFFQGSLDQLLLDLVDPLLVEIAPVASESFFLRYWNGGPHLRLRVRPASIGVRADVEDLVRHRAEEYLRRFPSSDVMQQADYAASGKELAQREGVDLVETMYPNNSLAFIDYARELDRYGDSPSIDAVESHFVESSALALDLLRADTAAAQRETAVIACLMLSWMLAADDLGALASAQLARAASAGSADAHELQSKSLKTLVRLMGETVENWRELPEDGSLVRWARTVSEMSDQVRLAGRVSPSRVADLCTHLFANRLGVRIDAEGTLRHMAARAISDSLVPEAR